MNPILRNYQKLLIVFSFCIFLCVCLTLLPQTSKKDNISFDSNPYNNMLRSSTIISSYSDSDYDNTTDDSQLFKFLISPQCTKYTINNFLSDSSLDLIVHHQTNQQVCQLQNIPPPLSI
jgi:hypothetical protein